MRDFMKLVRTLHIYVSMFGLIILLFFSLTGFTLNHADWFVPEVARQTPLKGSIDAKLLAEPDKLAVVELLRRDFGVTGFVDSFEVDDEQCHIDFKRPGSFAHVDIDRLTGEVDGELSSRGAMAVINDLHMGRDSGGSWSLVIDITAWLMTFVSISGMMLLLQLPKRRAIGLVAMIIGLAASVAVYVWLVP